MPYVEVEFDLRDVVQIKDDAISLSRHVGRVLAPRALDKVLYEVVGVIQTYTPTDTGLLKSAIEGLRKTYHTGTNEYLSIGLAGVASGKARVTYSAKQNKRYKHKDPRRYYHIVENGSKNMAARPYIRKGWEWALANTAQMVGDNVWVGIEKWLRAKGLTDG